MHKNIFILLFLCCTLSFGQAANNDYAPSEFAFKQGEWLKFRLSYSNFLNAGYATLEVKHAKENHLDAFHIKGFGESTGIVSWFFKVEDDYQSYFYKETLEPYRFIRKINEGGYKKNKEILFDQQSNIATVKNHKNKTEENYPIEDNIQDMISALYYIRNQDISNLSVNDEIELKLFFDQETYIFKLLFLGKEVIKTKFGNVKSLKFRPMVQAGRVFKEQESVTIWVTDDKNKIPLKIKASLAVGSLRADLDQYKGLAHPFNIIFDN